MAVDVALIHLVEGNELALGGAVLSERLAASPRDVSAFFRVAIDDASLVGRAALQQRTVSGDLSDIETTLSPTAAGFGVRYVVVIPLVTSDRLLGTLSVARSDERSFSEDEIQLLESCAGYVGVTIAHARLFEDERRRVLDLRLINDLGALIGQHLELAAVLATGVHTLARLADVPNVFLMLVDPTGVELRHAGNEPRRCAGAPDEDPARPAIGGDNRVPRDAPHHPRRPQRRARAPRAGALFQAHVAAGGSARLGRAGARHARPRAHASGPCIFAV